MARLTKYQPVKTDKGWRLNVPSSLSENGKRQQRFFPTRDKALEFAQSLRATANQFGQSRGILTPAIQGDAETALQMLARFGVTLRDAASFYIAHHDHRAKCPTVADAFKRTLSLREKLSERYKANLRTWQRKLTVNDFGEMNVADVDSKTIVDFLNNSTNGKTVWKSGHTILSAVFADLVKAGTLKENPVAKTVIPKTGKQKDIEIYTIEETKTLMEKAQENNCGFAFALLAFAGIRPKELTRLEWEDICLERKNIRISNAKSKTGTLRNVRINDTLAAWIETVPTEKRVGKLVNGGWEDKNTKVRKAANLPVIQDGFRHSYASYKFAVEKDLNLLLLDLGHSVKIHMAHYQAMLTEDQAKGYWEILPA